MFFFGSNVWLQYSDKLLLSLARGRFNEKFFISTLVINLTSKTKTHIWKCFSNIYFIFEIWNLFISYLKMLFKYKYLANIHLCIWYCWPMCGLKALRPACTCSASSASSFSQLTSVRIDLAHFSFSRSRLLLLKCDWFWTIGLVNSALTGGANWEKADCFSRICDAFLVIEKLLKSITLLIVFSNVIG